MRTGKRQLKRVLGIVLSAAFLVVFAGCRSSIELAMLEREARSVPTVLELSDLYSEAEGFHYPGFSWGGTFKDFQALTDGAVTEFEGYTDFEEVFTLGDLHKTLLGRKNDSGSIGLGKKDVLTFVSLRFGNADDGETLGAFDERMQAELIRLFGEPTEITDRDEEANTLTYRLKTMYWRKEAGDRITELQWGTATLSASTLPSMASLGVNWTAKTEGNSEAQ